MRLFLLFGCLVAADSAWAQGFAVSSGLTYLVIHPGDTNVSLPVQLTGDGTASGPVTVTLTGLPSGITVSPVVLSPGSSGVLSLSATRAADQEAFPAAQPNDPDYAVSTGTILAFAGAQQATASFQLIVSLENPAFAPPSAAINLPIVSINTSGVPIASKSANVPGTVTITSADGQIAYLPGLAGSDNTANFQLHGNSTSVMAKKPYEIKLNTSTDLLNGMGLSCPYATSSGKATCDKSKSYLLLANYADKTMLRDWSASALANAIPIGGQYLGQSAKSPTPSGTSTLMPWAPHSLFVELYVNGAYEGSYQLIEQVKVDSHRVNITEMADSSISGSALTGGYLVEIDQHQAEDYVWTSPQGVKLGLVDPNYSPELTQQTSYISGYVNAAETALFSSNFTDSAAGWPAFFDRASAVNFFLVEELLGNVDGGSFYSSVYLYKDRSNPLLYMGPVWDFDLSSGNAFYAALDPTAPWMSAQSPWYRQFFSDPAFKQAARTQWNALKGNGVLSTWLAAIGTQAAALEQAQQNNFGRWPMLGIRMWPNVEATGTYDGEVGYFTDWLRLRMGYMDAFLNDLPATTTTLTVPPGTLRTGTPVTLTAQVTGNHPTGTVTFSYNSIVVGSGTLDSSGTATLSTSTLAPGSWYIEAYYNGDEQNAFSGVLGPQVTVLAPLVQSTSSLSAPGPFTYGAMTTLTAAVAGVTGFVVPTGTVSFVLNGNALGTAPVGANGLATLTTDAVPLGEDTLQAFYSGDLTFAASTSNSLAATASQGTAIVSLSSMNAIFSGTPQGVVVLTQPSGLSTSVTYNGTSNSPTAAGSYTVVATVHDADYTGTATGTFTIAKARAAVTLPDMTAMWSGTPQKATATTQPTGLGTSFTYDGSDIPPTAAGTYSVVATVNDANYAGTATATLTITKATATITLPSSTVTYNGMPQPVVASTLPAGLSTIITYNGNSTPPTSAGTYAVVSTINDAAYVGRSTATLTISPAAATINWTSPAAITYGTPLSAAQLNAVSSIAGSFTYAPGAGVVLGAGTQTLSLTFTPSDQTDYTPTTRSVDLVVDRQSSSVGLSATTASLAPHQPVTLTAAILGTLPGTPSGSMAFYDGKALLSTQPVVNGVATFNTAGLLSGVHLLTAAYSGDANYQASVTAGTGLALTVASLDFTFNGGITTAVLSQGGSNASLEFDLAPTYGEYPGQVSFSVSGLPTNLYYTLSQDTVASDEGPVRVTLTILPRVNAQASLRHERHSPVWAATLLLSLAWLRGRRRVKLQKVLMLLTACLALHSLSGCGGQAVSSGQNLPLIITATSGTVQHTAQATLTVY